MCLCGCVFKFAMSVCLEFAVAKFKFCKDTFYVAARHVSHL